MDAAIFCLALMGTDYGTFLEEACRVLHKGGFLWVAEVRSRFADDSNNEEQTGKSANVFGKFRTALKNLGFQVTEQDISNKMFVVFVAQKVKDRKASVAVQWPHLKPCIYKRR